MSVPIGRILAEKRRLVLPVVLLLLANAAVYGLAVYPLALKAAGARARAAAAESELQSAERALASVRAVADGKIRAGEVLEKFYTQILPPNLAGARRITYLRLTQLAETANLRSDRRSLAPSMVEDSALGRLRITMVLEGEYDSVRQFIYELETASEFVVIDDVALSQGAEESAPLVLTLQLSTYFPKGAGGSG